MMHLVRRFTFPFLVFITGATDLVLEIVAIRILSPYFGNSIYTDTSVIATILGALSLGYFVGGRLSDRYPSGTWFFGFITAGAVGVVALYLFKDVFLAFVSDIFPLTYGPLIASLSLFFIPSFLLGMLSPFAVILQKQMFPDIGPGSNTGEIFFFSTFGSIAGSILAGFVLIPSFGISVILQGVAVFLFILSILGFLFLKGWNIPTLIVIIIALCGMFLLSLNPTQTRGVYYEESLYNTITVYEGIYDGRKTRFLNLGKSTSGATYLNQNHPFDSPYDYIRFFELYKVFKPQPDNTLVIGGGAYLLPRELLKTHDRISVDVAEIDPSLYTIAQTHFNLPQNDTRLTNHAKDGRRYLQNTSQTYDIIYNDAYKSLFNIPAHMMTKEYFALAHRRLDNDGVFIANVIGSLAPQEESLLFSAIRTFQTEFDNTVFFATESTNSTTPQNIMFIGYKGDKKIPVSQRLKEQDIMNSLDEENVASQQIFPNNYNLAKYPIFTDNYAPVDYLAAQLLQQNQ